MTNYGLATCIGEITLGMPYPVFWDPHYASQCNLPPAALVTGGPGSGKTFFGMMCAAHSAILGKQTIVIDPKKDFIKLKLLEKNGHLSNVNIWSLMSGEELSKENIGILDPTTFYKDYKANAALTVDVIQMLVGNLSDKQTTALYPIVSDVTNNPRTASMSKIVMALKSNRDTSINALGIMLESILNVKIAQLLVADKKIPKKELNIGKGTTVIDLSCIALPDENSTKAYTTQQKVSICIMFLITQLILDMIESSNKKIYKTLIIDEAWVIKTFPDGEAFINRINRLGRSLRTSPILLSQSPTHINSKDLNTLISSRFAFKNKNLEDNKITIQSMSIPENEGWENKIAELEIGECLFQNAENKTNFIYIYVPDEWAAIFDTNPETSIRTDIL